MKPLALLIALFVMVVGVTGVIAPDRLITIGRQLITPTGLYVIGGLRVAIGLILFLAARASRAPRTLRVLGVIVIIAGLTTPLFGVERARAILDWESHGTQFIRVGAALAIALGALLAFLVGTGPRAKLAHRVP
jgi:hypothetical protein